MDSAMHNRLIHSVGIDIGTTTTQMIFSKLALVNRAAASRVPHYEFSEREIIYVSPIISTPIDKNEKIDQERLSQFINAQYLDAGFKQEQIESGAIIITGETSKIKNARDTIMHLAAELGNFVVATAGAHLESVIAGKGSGAREYSQAENCRVLNMDIGGGTTNYVVFEAGRVVDTACLNIGGHLIETDEYGQIKKVHEPAKKLCAAYFCTSVDATALNMTQLDSLIKQMASLIVEVLLGTPSSQAKMLLMTECLHHNYHYDAIFISGGVGECFYHPQSNTQIFAFKDIGPTLANKLHQHPQINMLPIKQPKQTIHATVIGAGAYTLSLSGSTVWISAKHLPIRNVPILHTHTPWLNLTPKKLSEEWKISAKHADIMPDSEIFALALPTDLPIRYSSVKMVVEALQLFSQIQHECTLPLIVIAEQDVGKVLGMELQPLMRNRELAIIDEVKTQSGDYIDIGQPFLNGSTIPLTIKSLAFPS